MLQRGNAYHMGCYAGAWDTCKNRHPKSVNLQIKDACQGVQALQSSPE
jgi:hypothetical protein